MTLLLIHQINKWRASLQKKKQSEFKVQWKSGWKILVRMKSLNSHRCISYICLFYSSLFYHKYNYKQNNFLNIIFYLKQVSKIYVIVVEIVQYYSILYTVPIIEIKINIINKYKYSYYIVIVSRTYKITLILFSKIYYRKLILVKMKAIFCEMKYFNLQPNCIIWHNGPKLSDHHQVKQRLPFQKGNLVIDQLDQVLLI